MHLNCTYILCDTIQRRRMVFWCFTKNYKSWTSIHDTSCIVVVRFNCYVLNVKELFLIWSNDCSIWNQTPYLYHWSKITIKPQTTGLSYCQDDKTSVFEVQPKTTITRHILYHSLLAAGKQHVAIGTINRAPAPCSFPTFPPLGTKATEKISFIVRKGYQDARSCRRSVKIDQKSAMQ